MCETQTQMWRKSVKPVGGGRVVKGKAAGSEERETERERDGFQQWKVNRREKEKTRSG